MRLNASERVVSSDYGSTYSDVIMPIYQRERDLSTDHSGHEQIDRFIPYIRSLASKHHKLMIPTIHLK